MERTGGEPDVVGRDKSTGEYLFYDCSAESPKGRRSLCYDREALNSRKENKPKDSAMDMAAFIGIELLTEEQYRELQKLGNFDTKTSSWVKTPSGIRKLGGALFCDRRFGSVFLYHNGAESYYAARGFRGFSLADRKNVGDISRQLFVVELPNDLVDSSYSGFQMVRGRNWSAFHGVETLLF